MFFASITTKNGNLGTTILADNPDAILAECLKFQLDNKLSHLDIADSKVIHRETGIEVGDIIFEHSGVVFDPHEDAPAN